MKRPVSVLTSLETYPVVIGNDAADLVHFSPDARVLPASPRSSFRGGSYARRQGESAIACTGTMKRFLVPRPGKGDAETNS